MDKTENIVRRFIYNELKKKNILPKKDACIMTQWIKYPALKSNNPIIKGNYEKILNAMVNNEEIRFTEEDCQVFMLNEIGAKNYKEYLLLKE